MKEYGYKIYVEYGNNTKVINICKDANETMKQLEYYIKFPPYYKIKKIRIYNITKKEVENGIFRNLPWYQPLFFIYKKIY